MGFLFFIFILFALTKKDMRKSDLFKGVFGLSIGLTVLLSLLTSGFSGVFGLLVFAAVILFLSKRGQADEQDQNRRNAQEREVRRQEQMRSSGGQRPMDGQAYQQWQNNVNESWKRYQQQFGQGPQANYGTPQTFTPVEPSGQTAAQQAPPAQSSRRVTSYILPRSTKKRRKILETFNKKFSLSLSDEEIKRIVDASYISDSWKTELEAMSEKYDSVYQWFMGPTSWLRVYLNVFELQTISSDFDRQEIIVRETFDEVFRYAASLDHFTLEERIRRVNDRFFTFFDEVSFMIAYRYMESQGRAYDILSESVDVVKNESEADALARKYDSMPMPGTAPKQDAAVQFPTFGEEEEGEGMVMEQGE